MDGVKPFFDEEVYPEASVLGLPDEDAEGEDVVVDAIEEAVESIPRKRRRDPELVREAARRAARAAVLQRWGKKPVCKILVSVID